METVIIVIMVLVAIALIAIYVSYYACEQEAKIVAVLKGGVLAYIENANEFVYVENTPGQMEPSIGDIIKVKHPLVYNLKHLKEGKSLPASYDIKFGNDCSFWAEELQKGFEHAVLLNKITSTKWLANCREDKVIIELDEDGYNMGDEILFLPLTWTLRRFYYV